MHICNSLVQNPVTQTAFDFLEKGFRSLQKIAHQCLPIPITCCAPKQKKVVTKFPALNPKVTYGKLDNGLTYYIMPNTYPDKKMASLQLLVRAGSVNETEQQRGLAHFVEHLAGKETASYSKDEIDKYLHSIGCAFGADENAWTSFTYTKYHFNIPINDEGSLEKSLGILSEIGSQSILSTSSIENERAVILDEFRQSKSCFTRYIEKLRPLLLKGTPYPDRETIGLEDVIKNCAPSDIRDYYHRWYQPNNIAIVAVGDFEVEKVKALVQKFFGSIPASEFPPATHNYRATPHEEERYLCFKDKEVTVPQVSIHCKRYTQKPGKQVSENHVKRGMIENLIKKMFNQRLTELAEESETPFTLAFALTREEYPGVPLTSVGAVCKDGKEQESLKALLTEMKRLKEHGLTDKELEMAKTQHKSALKHALLELDQNTNYDIAKSLARHFLDDDSCPDLKTALECGLNVLEKISLEEVNSSIKKVFTDHNRVITALGKEDVELTEADLQATTEEVKKTTVTPYNFETVEGPFIKSLREPGKIVSMRDLEHVGGEEWVLENGMHIWLKPTDFNTDTIKIQCSAIGGYRMASEETIPAARIAEDFLDDNGLGGFTPKQMNKLFADKHMGTLYSIHPNFRNISGAGAAADIGPIFEIIHQLFNDPQYNPEIFEKVKQRLISEVKARASHPGIAYAKALIELNTMGHPASRIFTTEDIEKVTFEDTKAFLEKIYANPADFNVFIVGNYDREAIKTYVENYLANLPVKESADKGFTKIHFPTGITEKEVHAGKESACASIVTFPSQIADSLEERALAEFAGDILVQRLVDKLRFEETKTYCPICVLTLSPFPGHSEFEQNKVSIRLTGETGAIDSIFQMTKESIEKLIAEGPTEEELKNQKTISKEHFRQKLKTNTKWQNILVESSRWGFEPKLVHGFEDWVDGVSKDQVQQMLKQLLPLDRYTRVTLFPEEQSKAPEVTSVQESTSAT